MLNLSFVGLPFSTGLLILLRLESVIPGSTVCDGAEEVGINGDLVDRGRAVCDVYGGVGGLVGESML